MLKIIEYDNEISMSKSGMSVNDTLIPTDKSSLHYSRYIQNKIEKIFSIQIKKILYESNFLVIKNFGINTDQFIRLNLLISKNLYFSQRMGSYLHSFKIEFYSKNLSECANSGQFHTDFSFQKDRPNYIALQCIDTDPKYPFLGRNYIVNTKDIFYALLNQFHQSEQALFNLSLPYSFGDKVIWINPFYRDKKGEIAMRIHLSLVDASLLKVEHYINGIPITVIIENIALNKSTDFVLDQGDVLILSNKYLLHKRGECSINIQSSINNNNFCMSRKMNSIRFY
jgi:hypothetical protein